MELHQGAAGDRAEDGFVGTAAEQGPGDFLRLMALLSMNLAFVNLLPIPVLDGGHMVFLTLEAIMRRPVSEKVAALFQWLGLLMILCLMVWVFGLDIMRLF